MILEQRQGLPLDQKIVMSKQRIQEWYDHWDGDVYISFSGGKDSTVLRHLVKEVCKLDDVPAVYCDTGLEYPEVREFALRYSDEVLKPKMTFKQVIEKYSYPVVSKEQASYIYEYKHSKSEKLKKLRLEGSEKGYFKISEKWKFLLDAPFEVSSKCCDVMKKNPTKLYEKRTGRKPYLGNMADESNLRKQQYTRYGCNAYEMNRPRSTPMGFWTEQDVLRYLKDNGLEYASVYGEIVTDEEGNLFTTGCDRTGCMFCMFGVQLEDEPNRFQRMAMTHPKLHSYCIEQLGLGGYFPILEFLTITMARNN